MKAFNHQQKNTPVIPGAAPPAKANLNNPVLHFPLKSNCFLKSRPVPVKALESSLGNVLLSALSQKLLAQLAPFFERVAFASEQYLYRPDNPIKYLYFPETAVISEFRIIENGSTIETAMIGREGLTGFASFLAHSSASGWTQILVGGTALRIRAELLRHEFGQNAELQTLFLSYLSRYINQIAQRSVCHAHHSVEQRYCSWLLMLAKRSVRIRIPLTQERVARSLGVHRPSVSKIAKDLQCSRGIKYQRGSMTILDSQTLERAACDCYRQIDL